MRLSAMTGDAATFAGYIAPQAEIKIEAKRLDQQTIETGQRHGAGAPLRGLVLQSRRHSADRDLDRRRRDGCCGSRCRRRASSSSARTSRRSPRGARTSHARGRPARSPCPPTASTSRARSASPRASPDAKGRFPAIVLVPGSGATDRDETVYGIPIFGQLAGAARRRGLRRAPVRQARHRPERRPRRDGRHERLHRGRARRCTTWLRKRKDVDDDRIALVGHSEGALGVDAGGAAQGRGVAALVLVAGPSGTGADLVLEQQQLPARRRCSSRTPRSRPGSTCRSGSRPPCSARVTGRTSPADLRQQADTNWFRTFLAFSPEPGARQARSADPDRPG